MELAIPLIALGGMYVISNQNNTNNIQDKVTKEKFTNMGRQQNYLPNTNTPPQNYPVTNLNQANDTVQQYPNPNQATDKYFNQTN